jgi:hypothetical protein
MSSDLGLNKNRAIEVQRIATIPGQILAKRFRERESKGELTFIKNPD